MLSLAKLRILKSDALTPTSFRSKHTQSDGGHVFCLFILMQPVDVHVFHAFDLKPRLVSPHGVWQIGNESHENAASFLFVAGWSGCW